MEIKCNRPIHYPKQWYVERLGAGPLGWVPLSQSVGNKSYAQGFLNALDSIQPHPAYRLIDKDGDLYEVRDAKGAMRTN